MTDPKIRLLFTHAQLIGMGRCPDCGWHPKTQGHHPECPTWDEPAPGSPTVQQQSTAVTRTQEKL